MEKNIFLPFENQRSMPAISVIMSIYKENEMGIRRAVDSILNQTFKDFEFIIIADDPTNITGIDLIKDYAAKDSRIKYIVHVKNLGLSAGLNEGIRMATGTYIARQDAEDESLPERLQTQYDYLQNHPEVDVLGTALMYVDTASGQTFKMNYKPIVGDEIKKRSPVGHPTLLIKREIFEKYGFYKEGLVCEDYDLWIRWFLKGVVFHNLQESFYDYYQTFSEKARKTKPYLVDTINCKRRYTRALHFNFGDYFYLFAERICALLPANFIVWLVYTAYRIKHPKPNPSVVR